MSESDSKKFVKELANRQTNRPEAGKRRVLKGITPKDGKVYATNAKEDALINAIDNRDFLLKHAKWIEKLQNGQIGVDQFLSQLAPEVALALAKEAFGADSAKIRVEAQKDLLDRAGFGKVQKHAIAAIDPNAPKEELIALIEGLNKKTKTIEIVDDAEAEEE